MVFEEDKLTQELVQTPRVRKVKLNHEFEVKPRTSRMAYKGFAYIFINYNFKHNHLMSNETH